MNPRSQLPDRAAAPEDAPPRSSPRRHLGTAGAGPLRALLRGALVAAVLLAPPATGARAEEEPERPPLPDPAVVFHLPLEGSAGAPWLALSLPAGWWREPDHVFRDGEWVDSVPGGGAAWMRARDPTGLAVTARLLLDVEPLGRRGLREAREDRVHDLRARRAGRVQVAPVRGLRLVEGAPRGATASGWQLEYTVSLSWATPVVQELLLEHEGRLLRLTYQHVGGRNDFEEIRRGLRVVASPATLASAKLVHYPDRVARYLWCELPPGFRAAAATGAESARWTRPARGPAETPAHLSLGLVRATTPQALPADVRRLHARRATNPLLADVEPPRETVCDGRTAFLCRWTDVSFTQSERPLHVGALYVESGGLLLAWTLVSPDPLEDELEGIAARARHSVGTPR